MSLLALPPFLGSSFLIPTLLATLVLTILFLIHAEKRNGVEEGVRKGQGGGEVGKEDRVKEVKVEELEKEEKGSEGEAKCTGSSACSSSGHEEEEEEEKKKKSKRRRKKHSCEGAGACSSKKTLEEVVLVTDEGELCQVVAEELSVRLGEGGLACSGALLAQDVAGDPASLRRGPTVLNVFLVASTRTCEDLCDAIQRTDLEHTTFIYTVACAGDSQEMKEALQKLSEVLGECGGTEWVPFASLTSSEVSHDSVNTTSSSVNTTSSFSTQILEKVKKVSKKCCGTSCGSKKSVDIEDLAASFLPVVTPVRT